MLHCDVPLPDPRHPRHVIEVGGVFARPPTEAEARRWWQALSAGAGPEVKQRLATAWNCVPVVNASLWETAVRFIRGLASVTLCGSPSSGESRGPERGTLVDRAKAYALDNLAEPITSRTAAEHVRVCLPHFCRAFRRATGCTFLQFVAEARLTRAKSLLAEPDRAITDVAFAAGFQSVWQFNHRFKARTGLSPSAYRAHLAVRPSTGLSAPAR
jgi:AraC-like DNA-binding protein